MSLGQTLFPPLRHTGVHKLTETADHIIHTIETLITHAFVYFRGRFPTMSDVEKG